MKASLAFPGCGMAYTGNEKQALERLGVDFDKYIMSADSAVEFDSTSLEVPKDRFPEDELQSQFSTYIISCAFADVLSQSNLQTKFVSGYSMGLYAALYHAGAISLEVGLSLIDRAFKIIVDDVDRMKKSFGLSALIGLHFDIVEQLIINGSYNVDIVNINNTTSCVVSGELHDLYLFSETALQEGAIKIKPIAISAPYHTKALINASKTFHVFIEGLPIQSARFPLISSIDQKKLQTSDQVREELVRNMIYNLNWMKTFTALITEGPSTIIECGPGKNLSRIARFIEGNFEMYSIATIEKAFDGALNKGTHSIFNNVELS
jgi:[acyl-carrier-protein] S-malonyltransferase